jgi:hypothetical protein
MVKSINWNELRSTLLAAHHWQVEEAALLLIVRLDIRLKTRAKIRVGARLKR